MKNRGAAPVWVPVLVALTAMAIALVAVLKEPEPPDDTGDLDLAVLEERIDQLEREAREARERGPAGLDVRPAPSPGDAPEPQRARPGDLEARIAALEKQLAEQRTGGAPPAALKDVLRERAGKTAGDEKSVADLQADAMDRTAAGYARLQALRRLRFLPNGRSRDVVLSMIELYRESDDPKVRADIFRQLSKVELPELRDAAIEALENDKDADVREEAAETLGPFRNDPAARDALERAAENDADEKVRKEAKDALGARR